MGEEAGEGLAAAKGGGGGDGNEGVGGELADLAAGFEEREVDAGEGGGVALTEGKLGGGFEVAAGGDVAASGEGVLAVGPEGFEVGKACALHRGSLGAGSGEVN